MKVLKISCGENHSLALIEIPFPQDEESTPKSSSENNILLLSQAPKVSTKLFVWGSNDKW
jgi:hypothetical protein